MPRRYEIVETIGLSIAFLIAVLMMWRSAADHDVAWTIAYSTAVLVIVAATR